MGEIMHTSNGFVFTSPTPDLRHGVSITPAGYNWDSARLASAVCDFAGWHALNLWPTLLGGFQGYDAVVFTIEKPSDPFAPVLGRPSGCTCGEEPVRNGGVDNPENHSTGCPLTRQGRGCAPGCRRCEAHVSPGECA